MQIVSFGRWTALNSLKNSLDTLLLADSPFPQKRIALTAVIEVIHHFDRSVVISARISPISGSLHNFDPNRKNSNTRRKLNYQPPKRFVKQ